MNGHVFVVGTLRQPTRVKSLSQRPVLSYTPVRLSRSCIIAPGYYIHPEYFVPPIQKQVVFTNSKSAVYFICKDRARISGRLKLYVIPRRMTWSSGNLFSLGNI